jgi:hypothetical protein
METVAGQKGMTNPRTSISSSARHRGSKASGSAKTVSIAGKSSVKATFSCVSPQAVGEIVVAGAGKGEYVVGWRRDRRYTRHLLPITRSKDRYSAISAALALSNRFVSPHGKPLARRRDFQRARVYRWERLLAPAKNPLSLATARELSDLICAEHGQPTVGVSTLGHRSAASSYFIASGGVFLAPDMIDRETVLHEMAHYLVFRMDVREVSHGPAFAAALLHLHASYASATPASGSASAEELGVALNLALVAGLGRLRSDVNQKVKPSTR